MKCMKVGCLAVLQALLLANRERAEPLFKGSRLRHLFHKEMNCSSEVSFSPLGVERILSASFS